MSSPDYLSHSYRYQFIGYLVPYRVVIAEDPINFLHIRNTQYCNISTDHVSCLLEHKCQLFMFQCIRV